MRNKKQTRQGFAYDALDSVIHERARLSVLTSLITHPKGLGFADLKAMCALTDGNLSRHLQVLRAAKLIDITKDVDNNRPHTFCRISANGRKRYLEYLGVLEQVIRDVVAGEKTDSSGDAAHVPPELRSGPQLHRVQVLPHALPMALAAGHRGSARQNEYEVTARRTAQFADVIDVDETGATDAQHRLAAQ